MWSSQIAAAAQECDSKCHSAAESWLQPPLQAYAGFLVNFDRRLSVGSFSNLRHFRSLREAGKAVAAVGATLASPLTSLRRA